MPELSTENILPKHHYSSAVLGVGYKWQSSHENEENLKPWEIKGIMLYILCVMSGGLSF